MGYAHSYKLYTSRIEYGLILVLVKSQHSFSKDGIIAPLKAVLFIKQPTCNILSSVRLTTSDTVRVIKFRIDIMKILVLGQLRPMKRFLG